MKTYFVATAVACFGAASCATGGLHDHAQPPADLRVPVHFPESLRQHTLANMRDHLLTLQQIQEALAAGAFDLAAETSEQRLGLSSLRLHGAHDVAKYMPLDMQEIGTRMHVAASRFAVEAANAGATADLKAPLAALSQVTAQCAACHSAYRLE